MRLKSIASLALRVAGTLYLGSYGIHQVTFASNPTNYSNQDAINCFNAVSRADIPGYVTDSPSESDLNHYSALESAISQRALMSESAQLVHQLAQNRPYFILDVHKDPIVLNSQDAVRDPEKFLGQKKYSNKIPPDYELKICEESKGQQIYTCTKTLIEPTIKITPAKYSHYWCRVGRHRPDDPVCQAKTYYDPARMYEPEKIDITQEAWANQCLTLETWVQKGICKLVNSSCPKGSETRDIVASVQGEGEPIIRSISRDCWQYRNEYQCTHPAKNDCEILRHSSCEQIDSECLKSIGDVCVVWKQTFKCFKQIHSNQRQNNSFEIEADDMIPHVPKNTLTGQYQPNTEFGDAMAKLSVLNEIQENLKSNDNQDRLPEIFKGKALKCVKKAVGFNNCCKLKGWGQKLNIAGCDDEAKELAQRRALGVCISTGSYKKGKLINKKTYQSYCCFPTKLARILHEQGRHQLGIGWGEAENPVCRGYTVTELAQLNFDNLNLQELFADIHAKMKQPDNDIVKRNLSHRFHQISDALHSQPAQKDY